MAITKPDSVASYKIIKPGIMTRFKVKNILFWLMVGFMYSSGLLAQDFGNFSGVVRADDTGETLIGAHIKLKGDLSAGAITDMEGKFVIQAPVGEHTFMISFTGMDTKIISVEIKKNETVDQEIKLKTYVNELQGVEIKVGRFDRPFEEITSSMEIIKPDIIQSKNVTNIKTILDLTPGLNILDDEPQIRGGSGFTFGVGSKVGIFIDDMPVLSGDASRPYWDLVPTENVGQIEVVKGCSSVLSGANALSGAIYIRTSRPKLKPETRIKLYSGLYSVPEDKYMKWWSDIPYIGGADYFHSRIINNTDFTIGANVLLDHGYIGAPRPTPPAEDSITDFSDNELAKKRYRLNFNIRHRSQKYEGLNYGLNGNFMYNKSSLILAWLNDSAGFYRAYPGAVILQDQSVFYLDPFVSFYSKIGINHNLKARILYNDTKGSNDQSIQSTVYFTDYNFGRKYEFRSNFAFIGGLTFQYNDVNSKMYTGSGSTNNGLLNLSGYSEIDINFLKLVNVSFGGRLEYYQVNDTIQETHPIFRAGASLKLMQETYLRLSIGQGYRYPTIAERFIRMDLGSFGVYDNPGLIPESSVNTEIGVKQGFKFARYFGYLDVAVFQQDYKNTIEYLFGKWDTTLTWPFYGFKFVNTGESRIIGADISVTGKAQLAKKLSLTTMLGYNYILPKSLNPDYEYANYNDPGGDTVSLSYRTTSVDPGKNILKYRFLHTLKADLELDYKNTSLGVSIKYFSKIENLDNAIAQLEQTLEATGGSFQALKYMDYFQNHNKGNFIFDLRISHTFKGKHKLSLISDNILNRTYSLRPLKAEEMRKIMLQYAYQF
jgi:outer membrane cobalamin receptor